MNLLHPQGILGREASRGGEGITAMSSKNPLIRLETP
jgi:hypothetical protein